MTEEQGGRIIQLLEKITESISNIESKTVHSDTLDKLRNEIGQIATNIFESERHLDRLETMVGHLPWDGISN